MSNHFVFALFFGFPYQRPSGGLSIPLCAFQGTVSLQAPTGKTLSLSTYEVSSDGLRISPNNAKKVKALTLTALLNYNKFGQNNYCPTAVSMFGIRGKMQYKYHPYHP